MRNRPPLALPALLLLLPAAASAVDSVVVFNEVHYHPVDGAPGGEWIELHNQMAIDIDVSGWHLEDGVNMTFAEGTIIPAADTWSSRLIRPVCRRRPA